MLFSVFGSIGTVYAAQSQDEEPLICVCLCDDCDELLKECTCVCEDCNELLRECICPCEKCEELKEECICVCEDCDEFLQECLCECNECREIDATEGIQALEEELEEEEDPDEPEDSPPPPNHTPIQHFIFRLYNDVLGREPEPAGFVFWTDLVTSGQYTGARAAHTFFICREFTELRVSNSEYINRLYRAFMDREPEPAGFAFWLDHLNSGWTREKVFDHFVVSREFYNRCVAAGIPHGTTALPNIPPSGGGTQARALTGKVIFLDPGHGTIGSPGSGSYNEAVAMLDLALRIKPLLEAEGATVILTRDSAINTPIASRSAMINAFALRAVKDTVINPGQLAELDYLIGRMNSIIANPAGVGPVLMNVEPFTASRTIHPDLKRVFEYQNHSAVRNHILVISLHSNAATSTVTRGAEVYYINPAENANTARYYTGYSYVSQSRSFANTLLNHIDNTGIPRRATGLRADNYAITRESNVPVVLAENGFHTNATDRALLSSATYRQELAVAYRNAVLAHYR